MDAATGFDLLSRTMASDGRARTGLQKIRALAHAAADTPEARERATRKAATEFEGVFLGQMLAPMFEGLKTDGPFGGGHAESIYRAMMVDEIGTSIARAGGIGIADAVYSQMLRLQEM